MNKLFARTRIRKTAGKQQSKNQGQGIVEYVLILALVGVAVVAIVNVMEPAIADVFSRIVNKNVVAPPALAGYTPPPTNTATATIDPNATSTFTPTPSLTPTQTETPLYTYTPTNTSQPTATNTATATVAPGFAACEYQETGGTVVIEAEHFASQNLGSGSASSSLWVTTTNFPGYSGSAAMYSSPNNGVNTGLSTNGPRMNYLVRIDTAASYYIYVRGRPETPDQGNNDSFHAGIDGTAVTLSGTGFTGYGSNANNFHWRRWSAPVSLTAGQHNLNIWMREDGMVVDRVILSTNSSLLSNGSTSTGPAESNAPAGCSGAPPPPPTSTTAPTATATATATPASATCAPTGSLLVRINFQRAGDPIPAGYEKDDGSAYGNRGNGFSYGWNVSNTGNARDRNNSLSPDQRYDTLNHMQQNGTFTWEIGVPNGTYEACLVAGDPSYTNSVHRINVEGTLAVDFTPTSNDRWGEGFATANVNDGRLTISNASGSSNNKIDFITIYTVSVDPATATSTPGAGPVEIIIDNKDAGVTINGSWKAETKLNNYYGSDYIHDNKKNKGSLSVTFTPQIPEAGSYQVYMWWPADKGNANNTPVDIVHANGTATVTVNQQQNGGQWVLLGTYNFNAGGAGHVTIRNGGTSNKKKVMADAVRFYKP